MQDSTFSLELQSDPKNVATIEPYVNRIVETYEVDGEMYGNILISLTEAVNNAIIHGNGLEQNKTVRIDLKKDSKKIAFVITDDGPGFDYSNLPDPTAPENILKLGGRGIFLMRQLADLVIFSGQGSAVELQFKL